jgi:carbamate kinase
MANVLGIEHMLILTAVPRVALDFGGPNEREIAQCSAPQMRQHQADGHFAPGSMGPKVEAAMRFVEQGGRRAIIAHLEQALPALMGDAGTHIIASD